MKMEMVKRRKAKIEKDKEEAEMGPDLSLCVLNDEDGNEKGTAKANFKEIKAIKAIKDNGKVNSNVNVNVNVNVNGKLKKKDSEQGPNNKLCYLAFAAPASSSSSSSLLDTSVCLI
jgi:hypothetical protein